MFHTRSYRLSESPVEWATKDPDGVPGRCGSFSRSCSNVFLLPFHLTPDTLETQALHVQQVKTGVTIYIIHSFTHSFPHPSPVTSLMLHLLHARLSSRCWAAALKELGSPCPWSLHHLWRPTKSLSGLQMQRTGVCRSRFWRSDFQGTVSPFLSFFISKVGIAILASICSCTS